jgi:hypothetical protein
MRNVSYLLAVLAFFIFTTSCSSVQPTLTTILCDESSSCTSPEGLARLDPSVPGSALRLLRVDGTVDVTLCAPESFPGGAIAGMEALRQDAVNLLANPEPSPSVTASPFRCHTPLLPESVFTVGLPSLAPEVASSTAFGVVCDLSLSTGGRACVPRALRDELVAHYLDIGAPHDFRVVVVFAGVSYGTAGEGIVDVSVAGVRASDRVAHLFEALAVLSQDITATETLGSAILESLALLDRLLDQGTQTTHTIEIHSDGREVNERIDLATHVRSRDLVQFSTLVDQLLPAGSLADTSVLLCGIHSGGLNAEEHTALTDGWRAGLTRSGALDIRFADSCVTSGGAPSR